MPLFPFHTWLPDAHVEAPTAGSVLLAGVLLKMGTYGLVRFAFPLFPLAASFFAPYLAILAVVGIIYGALVAMVQPDMKKLVAYSSVSHLGFVVLGITAMNVQGVQGAVYQMLNHGVSTGGLFLIVGMLSDRRHTRLIAEYGGLKKVAPHLVAAFLIITLSSIGLARPERVRRRVPDPARRVPLGSAARGVGRDRGRPVGRLHALDVPARELRTGDQREERGDARPRGRASGSILVPIVAVAVLMGVLPNLFLRPIEPSVARLVSRFGAGAGAIQAQAQPAVSSQQSAVVATAAPVPSPP